MIQLKLIPGLILSCVAAGLLMMMGGCANIVPPSGGPRDSIPPYAVYAKPKDSSIQIAPKEILISFNEYITTNALQEQLIVSPNIKNNPLVDQRLNMLRIRARMQQWRDNLPFTIFVLLVFLFIYTLL